MHIKKKEKEEKEGNIKHNKKVEVLIIICNNIDYDSLPIFDEYPEYGESDMYKVFDESAKSAPLDC